MSLESMIGEQGIDLFPSELETVKKILAAVAMSGSWFWGDELHTQIAPKLSVEEFRRALAVAIKTGLVFSGPRVTSDCKPPSKRANRKATEVEDE